MEPMGFKINIMNLRKYTLVKVCSICGKRIIDFPLSKRNYCVSCSNSIKNNPNRKQTRYGYSVYQEITCVCGHTMRIPTSGGAFHCSCCGMRLSAPGMPSIEIEGSDHKEVMEVAQQYYNIAASVMSPNKEIYTENELCSYIQRALLNAQKNRITASMSEDEINDLIRDNLSMVYEVHDQTRQGLSESEKSSGEIDLLIYNKNRMPIALIEAMRLSYLEKDLIDRHIQKVMSKYDPIGCPFLFVLSYVSAKNFRKFWENYLTYLQSHQFTYERCDELIESDLIFAESRHASVTLNRSGKRIRVHFFAIHISE